MFIFYIISCYYFGAFLFLVVFLKRFKTDFKALLFFRYIFIYLKSNRLKLHFDAFYIFLFLGKFRPDFFKNFFRSLRDFRPAYICIYMCVYIYIQIISKMYTIVISFYWIIILKRKKKKQQSLESYSFL